MRLCECGCGRETLVSTKTDPKWGWVKGGPRRFLLGHQQKGPSSSAWKGGRHISDSGYAVVHAPDHPRSKRNGYVAEHVLIAERALGRPLSGKHPVHHVDEDRANNARGNLVICEDNGYHFLLHQRMRALLACGDPSAVRCRLCGGYDRQDEMFIGTRRDRRSRVGRVVTGYHRECERAAYHRRRQQGAA